MPEEQKHKPPYETPDAVISAGYHHYKRLDGGRLFLARVWLAKLLRRKPPTQRFLIWIIYREWQERVQLVHFDAGAIGPFVEKLMASPLIRQVHVAEFWFKGRKSFGVDYDPEKSLKFILAEAAKAKTADAEAA